VGVVYFLYGSSTNYLNFWQRSANVVLMKNHQRFTPKPPEEGILHRLSTHGVSVPVLKESIPETSLPKDEVR
jgi:hypothetical protein